MVADQGRGAERARDADGSRDDILAVAAEVFAEVGFSGARVDAIAERTRTSKRMIYYHFGSKEGLYLAVLERAYVDIRAFESERITADLPPREALRRMIELTFDYDEAHPGFIRLVAIENIHNARHMRGSPKIRALNVSVIAVLRDILERGARDGAFRAGIDPVDIHMLISAFCFFRVANRHTFGVIFDRDMLAPDGRDRHRALIVEAVLRYLAPGGSPGD